MIKRHSKYELLRIFAMFLIIMYHCVQHGGTNNWDLLHNPFSLNYCITVLLGSWGQVGVIVFVLLSSWFLCDVEEIHSQKIVLLIFETWFYCIAITIFLYLCIGISYKVILKEILTPLYPQYWFITTYIVFYLTVPLMQNIVKFLLKDNKRFVAILIVYTVLIPFYNFIFDNVGGGFALFLYVFLLTAYLKHKENNWFERNAGKGFVLFAGLIVFTELMLNIAGTVTGSSPIMDCIPKVFSQRNMFVIGCAVCFIFLKD